MSALLASSLVISVGLAGAVYAIWARFRPRLTVRGGAQRVGATRVFDGAVDISTQDERGASVSGYICYIRRCRAKDEFPAVLP